MNIEQISHNKEEAVKIGIGLSTQFIAAALGLLTLVGSVITFLLGEREFSPVATIFLVYGVLSLLASIYFGFKGIAKARNNGNRGWWVINVSKREFDSQSFTGIFGIVFFSISIGLLLSIPPKKNIEQEVLSRLLHKSNHYDSINSMFIERRGFYDTSGYHGKAHSLFFAEQEQHLDSICHAVQGVLNKINVIENLLKTSTPTDSEKRNTWTIIISIILIIGGGALFLVSIMSLDWQEKTAVAITATLCSSLITLSGVKLYGVEKFEGEIKLYERNTYEYHQGDSTAFRFPNIQIDSIGAIRGFGEGVSNSGFNRAELEKVIHAIKQRDNIAVIFLMGEVDKRELTGDSHRNYGSNITLGRARAEFVKAQINPICKSRGVSILTMNRGAYHTGEDTHEKNLSPDRQVIVYCVTN